MIIIPYDFPLLSFIKTPDITSGTDSLTTGEGWILQGQIINVLNIKEVRTKL